MTPEQRRALRNQYFDALRDSQRGEKPTALELSPRRELVSKSALPSLADRIEPLRHPDTGEIFGFGERIEGKQETSKGANGLGDGVNDPNAVFDAAFPGVQSVGVEDREQVIKSADDEDPLESAFPPCLRSS